MNEKLVKIKNLLSNIIEEDKKEVFGSVTTEQGVIYWDGEEPIKVGDTVYKADENGENKEVVEDGDYVLEDKTVIKVENGKVSEIVEPQESEEESEESEEEEVTALSKFQKVIAQYSESYDEKMNKIQGVFSEKGIEGYIYEAGDDYAIFSVWDTEADTSKFIKYSVTWTDDVPTLGEGIEVELKFVPKEEEEVIEESEDFSSVLSELRNEINEMKETISNLAKTPASASVKEEFDAISKEEKEMSVAERYASYLRK